jgi:hypothetical protein
MRSLRLKLKHTEDYKKLRREAYPPIGEQLDALWHAMNSGTMAKAEPFYSMIKAVKDKFNKEVK